MREIKFRAWEPRTKRMGLVDCLVWAESGRITANIVFADSQLTTGHPALMQFTGLSDRLGKEIYEGDIIHGGFTVRWDKRSARFGCVIRDEWDDREFLNIERREVIGNLYENPELLKEVK